MVRIFQPHHPMWYAKVIGGAVVRLVRLVRIIATPLKVDTKFLEKPVNLFQPFIYFNALFRSPFGLSDRFDFGW